MWRKKGTWVVVVRDLAMPALSENERFAVCYRQSERWLGVCLGVVARTSRAAIEGRWQTTMRFWNGPQLLVVDELGYLPMPGEAASHLFQVITRRYEHGSIILTTNRGIADWGEIFEDTTVAVAILDRLLHHASVLAIT